MDLSFNAASVEVNKNDYRTVSLNITNVEAADVLNHFNEKEAADHFDHDKLLDEIGEEACKKYFGLVTPEND